MGKGGEYVCVAGHNFLMSEAKAAMGIDWMVQAEISQAIPPAYGEFIGRQVMQVLEHGAVNLIVAAGDTPTDAARLSAVPGGVALPTSPPVAL